MDNEANGAETKNITIQANDVACGQSDWIVDDPWKPSRIGIKSISYRPIGCIRLSKAVLEVSSTDGKRKWDVYYSFRKTYFADTKVPMIGTSLRYCSFCDTVAIDIDAGCTYLDLLMEVKIISVGAMHERPAKYRLKKRIKKKSLSTESCANTSDKNSDELDENRKQTREVFTDERIVQTDSNLIVDEEGKY
jgi:hypothetical protein